MQHHSVIDNFAGLAEKMGKKVTIKTEESVKQHDINDIDLVVSMGE